MFGVDGGVKRARCIFGGEAVERWNKLTAIVLRFVC